MNELDYDNKKPYAANKSEEFMNDQQVDYFKDVLLSLRSHLLNEATSTITHMQDDASQVADMSDRATLEEEFTLELKTRDRERKLIEKINQSLRLIDLNEYGYCNTCGAEIGLDRLNARPTAALCIDCKTIEEKQMLS